MAIIKTLRNTQNVAAIFEDPIPGGDYIYFQNDAYTKGSIAPLFDLGLVWAISGKVSDGVFGYSKPDWPDRSDVLATDPGRVQGILQLAGETTHVRNFAGGVGVNNSPFNNLDIAPFVSMDPNNKCTPTKYITDGVNNMVMSTYNIALNNWPYNNNPYVALYMVTAIKVNTSSKDLLTSNYWTAIYSTNRITMTQDYTNNGNGGFPIYRNPSTGNLVFVSHPYYNPNQGTQNRTPNAKVGHALQPAISANPTLVYTSQIDYEATGQFVGASKLDYSGIFYHQPVLSDHTQYFYKYNDQANTYTTLNTFSTTPLIPGSGGLGTYALSLTGGRTLATQQTATWFISFTLTNVTSYYTGKGVINGTTLTINTATTVAVPPAGLTAGPIAVGMTMIAVTDQNGVINPNSSATNATISSFVVNGTNQGGDRGRSYGNSIPKFASKTFTDTTVANTLGFYVPALDSVGNYQPYYYQWQQYPTDNFTRSSDITVNWGVGATQGTYWAPDVLSGSSDGANNYGMQRCWYNETFVAGTTSTRFLMLMQLHGAGAIWDSLNTYKTFPVFSINTATYKTLTYHSNIEVPATPKNIVWLSDDRLLLGIFCNANFYIYSFAIVTGWTQIANFPFQFNAVGRDNLGRIWAHDTGSGYGRLHLLTINVPVSISVVTNAPEFYYSGTTLNGTATVNTYSYNGSRLSTSVKLVIDGGSMTFAGNNLTITVTTSASEDTVVPIYITGGGVSNIIASASIT